MLKVIKQNSVTSFGEAVQIPDYVAPVVHQKVVLGKFEDTLDCVELDIDDLSDESRQKLNDYFIKRSRQMMAEVSDAARKIEASQDEIIGNAEIKAQEIISQANMKAEGIIESAKNQAIEICDDAKVIGRQDGQHQKAEEIGRYFAEITEIIDNIKIDQAKAYDDVYCELKYFALDVAARLVYKKIDSDDMYLKELVKQALKGIRDAEWVTVTLSDKLAGLVEGLKAEQIEGEIPENVEFEVSNTNKGNVVVNAPDRIVDASIATQLYNIKKYFETYGDEDNDQL